MTYPMAHLSAAPRSAQDDTRDDLVRQLKEENEILRERVALFEREFMGAELVFPVEWGLTATEQRVLGVLINRPQATKAQIMMGIYRVTGGDDEADIRIVDVFVCKVRKKLQPFGITIRTLWGAGYAIDEVLRQSLRRTLTQQVVAPEAMTS